MFTRRQSLFHLGGGLGGIALAQLLAESNLLADAVSPRTRAELNGGIHHKAKAKRVIQLFMNGGASQCDTFDYKPRLEKDDGKKFDPGGEKVEAVTSTPGNVMKCPFPFKQYGQCGRWVSTVFPHLAGCVDDLAFLMSMASKTNVHGPASYMMNTGFVLPGFPCLGSWLSYGLGSLNDNLPTFVVMPDARGLPYNNRGNFSSGFLPVVHQGTIIKANAPNPIEFLNAPTAAKFITKDSEKEGLALLQQMNRDHAAQNEGDSRLDARIASYELAAKMQLSAPEVLDLSKETDATKRLYGIDEKPTEPFGRNCLIARRMIEKGVRFVQVWAGGWAVEQLGQSQQHLTELTNIAKSVAPIAGLLGPEVAGLLEDTLLLGAGVRPQPFSQGSVGAITMAARSAAGFPGPGSRGARPMAKAMNGRGGPSNRPIPTTCTPPSCTCSASITPSSSSGTTAATVG